MASFNPKMMAHDVAKGLVYVNPVTLKKYSAQDLKAILSSMSIVQREVRAKQIPQENIMEIKEKNRQLQNLNQAVTVINGYIKQHHIRL